MVSLNLDFELTQHEQSCMAEVPAEAWFTRVRFRNAMSPCHPEVNDLDRNHELKKKLILPWIASHVKDKTVLDLFCGNGGFSFEAMFAGAKQVVGLEFSPERVRCAKFIASTFATKGAYKVPTFLVGDAYELTKIFQEPFDVVLALGGLYHVPDPPYVLTQIRALARERLIVQTSNVLSTRGNWAKFVVREDRRAKGLTSIIGGRGAWYCTTDCFENMMQHAGFKIVESCRPPFLMRRRFPWYCAVAEPTT
jgi:16S rRNA G966 N2-methylase RsmD